MSKTGSVVLSLVGLAMAASLLCLPQVAIAEELGNVSVRALPDNWYGNCPHRFDFHGYVQVNGPGSFNYHWERSDGAKGPVQVIIVRPGQRVVTVNTTWTLGTRGTQMDIYQILFVNSGNQHLRARSNSIPVRCNNR